MNTTPSTSESSEVAPWRFKACPCGCQPDSGPCVTERQIPDIDGSCCGKLGWAELTAAVKLGIHCASPAGCVARRLGVAE